MTETLTRRDFLGQVAGGAGLLATRGLAGAGDGERRAPNLLFVFADQWRAQATGYAGNREVRTPHLDLLADDAVVYTRAVSNCPVCSPFRGSLITGRYPLSHGVFLNDLRLNTRAVSVAQAYARAGYRTGYIGKWHLDGTGRSAYIPPERRQGFQYWKVLECTHNYNRSAYYANDDPQVRTWKGYDAAAQTDDAIAYLQRRSADGDRFALFLSWGPPHAPYRTGPADLLAAYDRRSLTLRPNVPPEARTRAQRDTAGYYAHIAALDACLGRLLATLAETGLDRDTIVVFTSDHGDMLHSRDMLKKQRPWDESIRIPFVLRPPTAWGLPARRIAAPLSVPDIMPTLLGLSGIPVPGTCEGQDLSAEIRGTAPAPEDRDALILCPSPFGQWSRRQGGREYRGLRTRRYTYVRDLSGPWLLYDNDRDPYQQDNLVGRPAYRDLQADLERRLQARLATTGDGFLAGPELIRRCGYRVDDQETVGYQNPAFHGQVSVSVRNP